jgi:hypothetical protein
MRIETSDDCAWRTDLDADVGDLLGGATRSGAMWTARASSPV